MRNVGLRTSLRHHVLATGWPTGDGQRGALG